jgi:ATP-dependent Clp protease ATP-binding subunit ClpX
MAMRTRPEPAERASTTAASAEPYCSFCLKAAHNVDKLVAGVGGIYICDACVRICAEYMAGSEPARAARAPIEQQPTERLLDLLRPIEETVAGKSNQLQQVVEALRSREVSWARIGAALAISRQSAWERFS